MDEIDLKWRKGRKRGKKGEEKGERGCSLSRFFFWCFFHPSQPILNCLPGNLVKCSFLWTFWKDHLEKMRMKMLARGLSLPDLSILLL